MVELNIKQKEFIKNNLKQYLEEDDIKGALEEICKLQQSYAEHLPDKWYEMHLCAQINLFLYELGFPILENYCRQVYDYMFCTTNIQGEIEIPSNILAIGPWAFDECKHLTSVIFNEGLMSIYGNAFEKTKIKSVTFPKSLHLVSTYAFAYCEDLSEVRLQGDVFIDRDAFIGSSPQIYVPKDVWENEFSRWYHEDYFNGLTVVPY